ncbi:hypothetical protein NEMBOFW57_007995 [Staphylotrichum longicolle]|uniref:F-box domain-containing protein n=1 Tax=Staphylotrichum longicolle TaxID=669026 RepID=A0AAD4EQJ7_9PEZI|nr:hypothetical protein NEMBOFW57_007995 [Staphylotrichum longicolle]
MASLFPVHIPLEILQQIVCQLDPISLIALSQASKPWRALINPLRHDHIQRMLALELLPEHGGIVPLFDEQTAKSVPWWGSEEWKSNKYACCGCMKLRSHMMFSNSAILRRPYRKPPPGSVEAAKAAITDWEPLEPSHRWRRIQERAAREQEVRAKWARAAEPKPDPTNPWLRVPRDKETEAAIAKYLVGTARQKRRCIDCELRLGNWSLLNKPPITTKVPVVKSRQLRFSDDWDRHFPGLVESLDPNQTPKQWRWYRGSSVAMYCTLLTKILICLLANCLTALSQTLSRLAFGWRLISRDFDAQSSDSPLAKHKAVGAEILDGLKWADARKKRIIVGESDLPDLRRRFERYKDFIQNEVDPGTRSGLLQSWFGHWVEDYDLIENKYHWLGQQIARLESDPNLVLNYVLERDPYRVSPSAENL